MYREPVHRPLHPAEVKQMGTTLTHTQWMLEELNTRKGGNYKRALLTYDSCTTSYPPPPPTAPHPTPPPCDGSRGNGCWMGWLGISSLGSVGNGCWMGWRLGISS